MKQGTTMQQLSSEVLRQAELKRDFLADTAQIEVRPLKAGVELVLPADAGVGALEPTRLFHGQMAEWTGIPRAYYTRMLETAPDLLATNANRWLKDNRARRIVRVLDEPGKPVARAFLSDKYRPLDYLELAEAILPVFEELPGLIFASTALTPSRLYIKATLPSVQAEVRVGEVVQAGVIVSDSEVGEGSIRAEPFIFTLACKNGMTVAKGGMKRYHLGGRGLSDDGDVYEVLRDETRRASDRALFLALQDVVRACLTDVGFAAIVDRLKEAAGEKIAKAPDAVCEVVQKRFRLAEAERSGLLKHLAAGGDLTRYGLVNAITAMSQDVEDYDRATELERLGGVVLELPRSEWTSIAAEA